MQRRSFIRSLGVLGVAGLGTLAGCGEYDSGPPDVSPATNIDPPGDYEDDSGVRTTELNFSAASYKFEEASDGTAVLLLTVESLMDVTAQVQVAVTYEDGNEERTTTKTVQMQAGGRRILQFDLPIPYAQRNIRSVDFNRVGGDANETAE